MGSGQLEQGATDEISNAPVMSDQAFAQPCGTAIHGIDNWR